MNTYQFARKWLLRFQKNEDTASREFSQDCKGLGFSMDCGQKFLESYPDTGAFRSAKGLERILTQITDPNLLGSAIYSKWRWITHWEYRGSLASEENKRWFLLALKRLSELTKPEVRVTPRKLGRESLRKITVYGDGRVEIVDNFTITSANSPCRKKIFSEITRLHK